jgi:hypothetical protein
LLCAKINDARTPLEREEVDRRGLRTIQRVIVQTHGSGVDGLNKDDDERIKPNRDGGLHWLAFLLSRGDALQIDWCRMSLNSTDARILSRAMVSSDTAGAYFRQCCTALLLSGNPIGDAGVDALAPALQQCRLERLELQNCRLGDAAAIVIATALSAARDREGAAAAHPPPRDRRLRRLCLGSNPIGDEGCEGLAAFLSAPSAERLEVLQLGDTAVGDVGAAAIAHALEEAHAMPHAVQLWLAATRISPTGRARLMEASVQRERLRICW